MIVYLDNASTTKPCEAAIAASFDASVNHFANPSSAHTMGQDAERLLKRARADIASAIHTGADHIVFTGSGTESDNLALRSVFKNDARISNGALIISSIEHPAVSALAKNLSARGVRLVELPVDSKGTVSLSALEEVLDALKNVREVLISVMHVNNEIGTIEPIAEIAQLKKAAEKKSDTEIFLHTDAVQSFGKLGIDLRADAAPHGFAGVDFMSFSAHKIHGPKGVGALFSRNPGKLGADIMGGGQEGGKRSGTENVPGIAGFAAALSERGEDDAQKVFSLRERLLSGIQGAIPSVRVNSPIEASPDGESGKCSPYILNVSFPGVRGEVILHDLEQRGVYVSTGSACSNIGKAKGGGALRLNPILAAIGLSSEEAEGAIRFGFSRYNTEEEIDYVLEHLSAAVARFWRTSSLPRR